MIWDLFKLFWIGLEIQLYTNEFCKLIHVQNVLDLPEFFGLVQNYFGAIEKH